MKKRFLCLIFVGSVALGWLAGGGVSTTNPPHALQTSQTRPERKTAPRQTSTAREAEFLAFAKRLPTFFDNEDNEFSKNLSPQDRGALIETLLKEGNPSGLKSEGHSAVSSTLQVWVKEDFESAWTWSQQIANDASRRFIMGEILEQLVDKDPTRAFALHLEMSAADPKFKSDAPLFALRATTPKSASDFINLLNKIPPNVHGGSTCHCDFARNFDFQQAAVGISALLKKQDQVPSAFPMNFMQVWGERDPDAAFAWLASEKPHNFLRFGGLLEGIEKQGVPGAASAWAAGKIEESESFRKVVIEGMCQAQAAAINGIVKALPDTNSSDRFLTGLFILNIERDSQGFMQILSGMSSPQARLEAFSQVKKQGRSLNNTITRDQYQALGVTQQQFESIFPPPAQD
jgi:hypothetical protein